MNELPFLDLFTRLRDEGFPLGIEEYQSFLRALQAGYGLQDRDALRRLCQTLWVKSPDEMHRFNEHFEQVIPTKTISLTPPIEVDLKSQPQSSWVTQYVIWTGASILGIVMILGLGYVRRVWLERPSPPHTPPPVQPNQNKPSSTQTPLPSQHLIPMSGGWVFVFWGAWLIAALAIGYVIARWVSKLLPERHDPGDPLKPAPSKPRRKIELEDKIQVVQALQQARGEDTESGGDRFPLTPEYFPVTQRQMKQSWRSLRRLVRAGPATELDVEGTVIQMGRQGFLLEPKLISRRINRTKLLLLIDQDGSMVPFHILSARLTKTARQGGRLGKADIYYFHNCPIEYLYHDSYCHEAEAISDVLARIRYGPSSVLIFSDAGSARGGYNSERLELTEAFLAQLKRQVQYIAWLNPVPDSRWLGTTADKIARLVPMFEFSRRGFQNAIDVLRVRSSYWKE